MSRRHLTLYDFRDIDLMFKLADADGGEGVSTEDLAGAIGFDDDTRAVAMRAAWMRRYGMFGFDPQKRLWRLSSGGERVVAAKKRAALLSQVDTVPDESMIDIMAHVTARYRTGDPMVANMLRREFQFGTSPRSSVWRG